MMERLTEELSFTADQLDGETIVIDETYVNDKLNTVVQDEDLSRFIL